MQVVSTANTFKIILCQLKEPILMQIQCFCTHLPVSSSDTIVHPVFSVSDLAKKVAGHQGLQLQKVVGPDEKL